MMFDNIPENETQNETQSETISKTQESDKPKKNDNSGSAKAFFTVAVIAVLSVAIVLCVVLIKNLTSASSPDETLKKCVTAAYEFDIDTYARYSTMNGSLRELLKDSDYDYEAEYISTKAQFDEMKDSLEKEYGKYKTTVEINNTSIYAKNTKEYADYLNDFSGCYSDSSKIEAFSKSLVTVYVEYENADELPGEEEEQEIYGVLIDGAWYLVI
ncbi:MAG: hypothetical protein K6F76_05625 [Clostridiales bacterium]|nr:hypothetical protein [Clostridiales bacterium]